MTHAVQVPRNPQQSAGYRTWGYCLLKNHAQKNSLQLDHAQNEVSLMELNPSWLRNHEK